MAHFPVTNSNLSASHLALFVQEKYGLGSNVQCKLIRAGINDTYLVSDQLNKYVFRVYSLGWRSVTEINEEIRLLNELKQYGIAVSYPIADKEGNYIQELNAPEGDRSAVLFSWAVGEKLHTIPAATHHQIGILMARMHEITVNKSLKRLEYTSDTILVNSFQELAAFLPADTEEMQFMQSAQSWLLQEWAQVDGKALRKGIVHLDIWFDNLNIDAMGQPTIFDFDFCGNGWLCLDIAYYILQVHNTEKYEAAAYQPKIDSFIKGYESVTSISSEEKRLLPALGVSLYFFYLGIQCQRYDNWSNSFLNENYLKRFINGLVKRYFDIYNLGKVAQ